MIAPISPRFVHALKRNLAFWHERICQTPDEVAAEHDHLLRAVQFGLVLAETQPAAAELMQQSFTSIEEWGRWQSWMPLLDKTVTAPAVNDPLLRVRLLNGLGRWLQLNRQLDQAIAIHQEARTLAQQQDHQEAMAETYVRLSEDYLEAHQYDLAEQYGKMALAEFEYIQQSERFRASALNVLGLIALRRGELTLAEENLQKSVHLWRSLDSPLKLARVLKNLGVVFLQRKEPSKALSCYQEALAHLDRTTSKLDRIEVQNNIGIIHFNEKQFDKAADVFRQAYHALQQLNGNFHINALLAQNLGNALVRQQHFAEAENHFRRGIILWQQFDNELDLANTWGSLGDVLARQGQQEAGLDAYARALQLLAKFPDNAWAKKLVEDFTREVEIIRTTGHPQPL